MLLPVQVFNGFAGRKSSPCPFWLLVAAVLLAGRDFKELALLA